MYRYTYIFCRVSNVIQKQWQYGCSIVLVDQLRMIRRKNHAAAVFKFYLKKKKKVVYTFSLTRVVILFFFPPTTILIKWKWIVLMRTYNIYTYTERIDNIVVIKMFSIDFGFIINAYRPEFRSHRYKHVKKLGIVLF